MDLSLVSQIMLETSASLIGHSDERELLSKAMPVFLRNLGGVSLVVFRDANRLEAVYALPRVIWKDSQKRESIRDMLPPDGCKAEEKVWQARSDAGHFYAFALPDYGCLALQRSNPFDPLFLKEILPLFSYLQQALCVFEEKRKRQAAQEALARSRSETFIELSNTGAWEYNLRDGKLRCSDAFFTMLGHDPAAYQQTKDKQALIDRVLNLVPSEEREAFASDFHAFLTHEDQIHYENTYRMRRSDGSLAWIWCRGQKLTDEQGNPLNLAIGTNIDITANRRMEEQLRDREEKLKATLLSVGDGVIATDLNGRIDMINRVAEKLTGIAQDKAAGQPVEDVLRLVTGPEQKPVPNPLRQVLAEKKSCKMQEDTFLMAPDGSLTPVEDSASPIFDRDGQITGAVLIFRDISQQLKRQKEIEQLSFRDQLTGLYNRRFFDEERRRLDTPRSFPLGLIMIDINGLKLLNDAFGHLAGDELLIKAGKVLASQCRREDLVARVGGDEFLFLLPRTELKECRKIQSRLEQAFSREKVEAVQVSASFGVAVKTQVDTDFSQTLAQAEQTMYHAKTAQRSQQRSRMIEHIQQSLFAILPFERQHAREVEGLCAAIGKAIGLDDSQLIDLRLAGRFHDIGRIGAGKELLLKEGPLTPLDKLTLSRHVEVGYNILSAVNAYAPLAESVLHHHESWDGTGFPNRLRGQQIPLFSRIIRIANSYSVMTGVSPLKAHHEKEEALELIRQGKGSKYDPKLVDVFLKEASSL